MADHLNDKLEEAKVILGNITRDIQEALTTAQFIIPTVETAVGRVEKRIEAIRKLLGLED